jgi:hypothetical protein
VQDGNTPLLLACERGHLEVAQWLVSSAGSNAATERNEVRVVAVWSCETLMRTRVWCLLAGWQNCASSRVCERTLGGRSVAGVVGGVECGDGENRGLYNAAVWLCVMLMQTPVCCSLAVWLHCASGRL